ncbi:hypothetical protein HAX54_051935 [Datura stramonium]|uniref:Uncharacterized protein n=1 Tax=Datura stramonium TaxID=4076 RepID=A0ABS8SZ57_DATST|nr:hypothetical protein [Datura stramonium]
MEVHGERREHAKGGHKMACEEVVGHLQGRIPDYKRPVGTNQVIGAAGAVNQLRPLIAAAMSQAGAVNVPCPTTSMKEETGGRLKEANEVVDDAFVISDFAVFELTCASGFTKGVYTVDGTGLRKSFVLTGRPETSKGERGNNKNE